MVTIKQIAKLANVSIGTVDRVLHDRGRVSEKTKKNIQRILKENNFKFNPVARSLAMKKKYNLRILLPRPEKNNLFWKSPKMGISKASKEMETFAIEITSHTFNQFDPRSYLKNFRDLMESNPDAVILVPTFKKETEQITIQLEKKKIPYMYLNIDIGGFNNISFIGQDSYKAGYLAGKLMHLCLHCKGDILILQTRLSSDVYHVSNKRVEGFIAYFEDKGVIYETLNLNFNDVKDMAAVTRKTNAFLKAHENIRGIFVPSTHVSVIADCIEPVKLKNMSLIGFDTTKENIECLKNEKVTFLISQKSFDQGYNSVKMMSNYLVQKVKPEPKVFSPLVIVTKENI